jgi:hypothetical protein
MKLAFTLLFLCFYSFSGFSQYIDSEDEALYRSKVENYTKLKKSGSMMTIAGIVMTAGGIALVSTADWSTSTDEFGYTTYNSIDETGIIGVTGIVLGVPLVVTGIVLNSVGKRKVNFYNEKLQNLNVSYFDTGNQKGLTLVYTF